MLIEKFAVDVILERRWGFRAGLFRLFLWLLSQIYGGVVRMRLWTYETGLGEGPFARLPSGERGESYSRWDRKNSGRGALCQGTYQNGVGKSPF